MPEDYYTGHNIELPTNLDDLLEDGFYEIGLEEDGDIPVDDDSEIHFNPSETVNGAVSLSEIATRLYDLADELTALSEDGWEIVCDVADGQATIVNFAATALD